MCFGSVRQKQLCLGLLELEAGPLDKGATQADLTGGHAAEVPLGKAGRLADPIPRIFVEYWLLCHNSPP